MKKNVIIAVLTGLVIVLSLTLTLILSQNSSKADEELSPITIMVTREGKKVAMVQPGELYTCYKSCYLTGDQFELQFASNITSYDYRLMAKCFDRDDYNETRVDSHCSWARTVGNAMNFLTIIGYDENGEYVAQATFIIDTSYLYRERD